jgi:hypothetical protein
MEQGCPVANNLVDVDSPKLAQLQRTPMIFLKRVLTVEQWALLLESAASHASVVKLSDPERAAKLHAVLEVFRSVPPGAFVEVRVGSNTLVD